MKKKVLLIVFSCVLSSLFAQDDGRSFWTSISKENLPSKTEGRIEPDHFLSFQMNLQAMETLLRSAPLEQPGSSIGIELEIPLADGSWQKFRVVETPMMHPDLAAAFPGIRTYSGQGIDNPAAIARFDFTMFGFHAMVLSPQGNFFIEPYSLHDVNKYICYDKKYARHDGTFICESNDVNRSYIPLNPNSIANKTVGSQLKTYRLALACTGEYAAYYGGTKAGALSGMVTSVNRVSAVYELELSIRLVLIPNDTLLIYTNAATDPYTNTNGSTMLGQNQTTITSVIGSANYDIGHVFSTGGGGVAGLGVVCLSTNKARGVTGSSAPIGDGFDIDYVAHEMGHQFGGNHTFNSATGSCAGGNRNASTAYESGSGITVMAYAGICGSDDLAPHSIANFHALSFDEITVYTTTGSGSTCPVATATGNLPPVVTSVGVTYSIPISTPFTLTGAATDANGDALTYSWEEYDLGAAGAWNITTGTAPLFRPFSPSSSPSRTFPKISDIVNNINTVGEILPTTARTMKFKLTVRDNRINGGGVMHPDTTLNISVINSGGAFSVTSPNTAVSWNSGTVQTINWNVSSTTGAPINCATVKISLSVDGGFTFPYVLIATTPNDGTEIISVPNCATTTARIKVEALGNIFFDMSNVNFTIVNGISSITTITTQPLATTLFCLDNAIAITFFCNAPTTVGNVFTAQLSNSSGSFTSGVVTLATLSSVNSGVINANIPAGLTSSSLYRVRVVSSTPAIIGTDNGSDITINSIPNASGLISGTAIVCQGQSGIAYSVPLITNASGYNWSLPVGASIVSGVNTNSITVNFSNTAVSGNISVIGTGVCGNGAASPNFAVSVTNAPTISSFNPATGVAGTLVTINGNNMNLCTAVKFNGVNATFTIVNNTQITATAPPGAGTGVINLSSANCNNNSITNFIYPTIQLNITAIIEGYYTVGGQMAPSLLNSGVSGALASQADTILIELHNAGSPYALVSSVKTILGVNGSSTIVLPNTFSGNSYYIVLKHRNALQTWSAGPVLFSAVTNYNFSTNNTQAYGNNMKLKGAVWTIYSGDIATQDEFIDASDLATIDNDASAFANGYVKTDINGDGFVDASDMAFVDNNAALFLFSTHP